MKRKLFMTIIAVLIVCLTCGMLLVACNKGDGDGGGGKPPVPETRPESSVTMLNTVWNQIASSINVGEGKKFVADFDIALNIDDETEANNDVVYSLIGKASVDVNAGQESDIYIELKETKNGESRILFGFAYDVETVGDVATPYIYVNVADCGYRKINGFSLTELVAAIVAAQPAEATAAGVDFGQILENLKKDPTTIFPVLVELVGLIDSEGTISDYGKTFNFNVNFDKLFSFLGTALTDEILASIGISAEQSAAIAQQVGAILGFENVENIGGLCKAVADALMFVNCELVFRFDDEQIFQSAEIKVDYNKNVENVPENVANYTVSVNKARIDLGSLDVFAGSAITEEVRNQKSVNLLNFSVKGSAVGYKKDGSVNRTYDIFVQSDINPFYLLQLIGDTSKENILATLKQLGYFHLEVNETTAGSEGNIITIHSNFADGFAVVQFDVYNIDVMSMVSAPLALGGVYDFDALIDVIDMLNAENKKNEGEEGTTSADEGGIDIMAILQDVIKYIHFDNLAENGLVLDIDSIFKTVLSAVNSLAAAASTSLTGNSETLAIKLDTPIYGNVTTEDYIAYENIKPYQMQGGYDINKDIYVKEVTGVADGSKFYIDPVTGAYIGTDSLDKAYKFKGIDIKGQEVEFYGYIMACIPVGEVVDGKQNAKLYIAQASEMVQGIDALGGFGLNLPSTAPLMGALMLEGEFDTFDSSAEKTFAVTRFYSGEEWWSQDGLIRINIGELVYTEEFDIAKAVVLDAEGNDVTSTVFKPSSIPGVLPSKINGQGTYTMKYNSGIGEIVQEIEVGKLALKYADGSLAIDGNFDPAKMTFTFTTKDKDGADKVVPIDLDFKSLSYNGASFDDIFVKEGETYKFKTFDLNLKKVTVSMTSGLGNSVSLGDITITNDYKIKEFAKYGTYFGNSLSNVMQIETGGVSYSVLYEGDKWIARSEDGQTLDITLTFEWTEAGSKNYVTFNADGFISNFNVTDDKYNDKVYYTLTIDKYTYSSYFTVYELSVSNKTGYGAIALNSKLDGLISYVDKIYYEADGEAKTLEFKYGAAGYGIYVKGTDTKVYNVKVTVFEGEEDVTSTVLNENGEMSIAGTYKVQYEIDAIYGTAFTISHNVEVKA